MENNPQRSPFERENTQEQVRRVIDAGEKAARNESSNVMEKAADKAKDVANKLRSGEGGDVAQQARAKAEELTGAAKEKAGQAADQIDSAMTSAGQQMNTLAQTVREKAPAEGRLGEVANTTAQALERSGEYLQRADLDTVRSDLETIIRRKPIESLFVGLGIGYLLARAFKR
jgi:ElaB/YqjD/DUF883 family membrane-anchored ribosome-binding protein